MILWRPTFGTCSSRVPTHLKSLSSFALNPFRFTPRQTSAALLVFLSLAAAPLATAQPPASQSKTPASGEPIAILPTAASSTPVAADRRPKGLPLWVTAVAGVMLLATLTYFALRPATKEIAAPTAPAKPIAEVEPTVPAVSEKSVAVLAFADLSEAHNS